MKYCTRCLIPDTKPYITFDQNGVCNACIAHDQKNRVQGSIDWESREKEFEKIVLSAKSKKAPFYDVLVPVSGGKDSITQVHRLLKYDLRILAVNVDYGIKTEIGVYNLSRIPKMGVNLAVYRPDEVFHRQLVRLGFEDFGDPDLLSHTLLHAYPLHVAMNFHIPLVLLGENSAFEYGGSSEISAQNSMTRKWFKQYAANSGYDAQFISQKYHLPMDRLTFYDYPNNFEQSDTRTIFMSYYFFWDSEKHFKIAQKHGFKCLDQPSEGTFRNYVGIDEKINRIHQYLKVIKFGYGRCTDHACEDIRNNRLTRSEAKKIIKQFDLMDLSDYYVNDFIDFIDIKKDQFFSIIEKYRNSNVWRKNQFGKWYIPEHLEENKQ